MRRQEHGALIAEAHLVEVAAYQKNFWKKSRRFARLCLHMARQREGTNQQGKGCSQDRGLGSNWNGATDL